MGMTNNNMASAVQSMLDSDADFNTNEYLKLNQTSLEQYRVNTAVRFCKYLKKYRRGEIGLNALLVSLRNYLLVFQTSVILPKDIDISSNPFGLKIDGQGKCYAVLDLPEYLNEKIIEQGFMRFVPPTDEQRGDFLGVSPNVYRITGYKSYRSLAQKIAVTGALNMPQGYTSLISLPTGGGKSLITQTMAYQKDAGLTIVVVPTVSLAMDQERVSRDNIKISRENEIFSYYGKLKKDEKERIYTCIKDRILRLLFISPEVLIKNERFRRVIKEANASGYLKNIIIDEAHIVIEWGTFFRVDYQCLEPWRNELIRENSDLRTVLLSATFERETVKYLKGMFSEGERWLEIRCDSLRREPRFELIKAKSDMDKGKKVVRLLQCLPRPMIVYVEAPYQAEEIKRIAVNMGFNNVELFTGRTSADKRRTIIKEWSGDEYDLIIATSAFGIGVDKSDVRTVLHLYVPDNANKYYQELGRGGRDGLPCLSVMCIYPGMDLDAAFNLKTKVLSTKKIIGRWMSMLDSPTSSRYHDTYTLDATVKPNYNDPDYAEDVNHADVKWNVYVILLLRRKGLITIREMTVDAVTQGYMFRIEINNYLLLNDTDELTQLINQIHDEEWKENEADFQLMKNAIYAGAKTCWSEMFFETYSRVSVYCAGCGNHLHVRDDEPNRFQLVKKIENPQPLIPHSITSLFGGANEAVMFTTLDNHSLLSRVISWGFQLLVLDDECSQIHMDILLNLPGRTDINFMGIREYISMLEHKDFYYVSGAVIVLYDSNMKAMYRKFRNIRNLSLGKNIKLLHIFEENLYFGESGKDAVSMIEGPVLEEYDVERM